MRKKKVLITGVAGLVGSEAARYFAAQGFEIIGLDNDLRRYFFGPEGSTQWMLEELEETLPAFENHALDIRDEPAVRQLFEDRGPFELVIHTAAQPSHDWAAREPFTDFGVNANGTLNLLEATRRHSPEAVFIFTSTNKVYGDTPNRLPLVEQPTRWEIDEAHPYHAHGIDEQMTIDQSRHSLFGASKVAADVMAQEYGRYFGLKTAIFRGGCLTGPGHAGAELHGFLSYLVKCAVAGREYKIIGYGGKQVRDNIHSQDLVRAFDCFYQAPRPGEVYNIGGGRFSNCSVREAIDICERVTGKKIRTTYVETARAGDHLWWISDVRKFQAHYPQWELTHSIARIVEEIFMDNQNRWRG